MTKSCCYMTLYYLKSYICDAWTSQQTRTHNEDTHAQPLLESTFNLRHRQNIYIFKYVPYFFCFKYLYSNIPHYLGFETIKNILICPFDSLTRECKQYTSFIERKDNCRNTNYANKRKFPKNIILSCERHVTFMRKIMGQAKYQLCLNS